jgi:hypothetical protein
MPDEMGKALYAFASIKVTKVSQQRTPVLSGALRGSHITHKAVVKWNEITVLIEVGGPAADYAVHVHYRDELAHATGQSRFLESALNDAKAGMPFQLAVELQRILRNKVR